MLEPLPPVNGKSGNAREKLTWILTTVGHSMLRFIYEDRAGQAMHFCDLLEDWG